MTIFLTILGLGFLLGLRHATDADHVIAISTLSAKEKSAKKSVIIGALWGIGHSAMVTIVGILIIFFSLNISKEFEKIMESSVGLMLVILGITNVFNIRIKFFQTAKPLIVGLIHGLAGSAAIALLILATIKNMYEAAFYLLIFNFGVIVGMMIITTLIGTSFAYAKNKVNNLHKYLVLGSGMISIIFGLYIIYARTLKV
ncbi:MAG: hypothetical protein Q7R51_01205 [bacterium]|nr:hypothetical protein [bacterium]